MPTKRNAQAASRVRSKSRKGSRRLRGKGDYSVEITEDPDFASRLEKKIDHLEKSLVHKKTSLGSAASMAGRALGTAFGQGDLGAFAGERLAKLFGHGDYGVSVKGNSLMAGTDGAIVPKFTGDGKRGVRITEREFLGNIVAGSLVSGSTIFTNQSFPINPTNATTFPWLSQTANLFDQWEPHGIVFEFHTTSSTFNGSSQALGAIIMATDYDVNDPIFASKQEMENADYACSTVPSNNLLHGVECDPKERPLDVMYTKPRTGQLNFSELGNFQIASQGCSVSGVTLGELWVSYDITFYKKVLNSPTLDVPTSSYLSSAVVGGPLIIPTTIDYQSQLTLNQIIGTGTQIVFPPSQGSGRYMIISYVDNNQTGDSASMAGTLVNCTLVNAIQTTNTAGSSIMRAAVYQITAPNSYVQLGLKNGVNSLASVFTVGVPPTFTIG